MAIEKALTPLIPDDPDAQVADLQIEVIAMGDEAPAMTINADGSVEIDLGGEDSGADSGDHYANLAEVISESELNLYPMNSLDITKQTRTSYRDWETDRKSTRLNSSHSAKSRMPSSA